MILYPFIDGKDGYEAALSDQQWLDFGAALKGIHTTHVPPALARLIPCETFSPHWREMVNTFQAQIKETAYDDPTAAKLAVFMKARQDEIYHLVARAEALALALRARPLELVLCHSDIHAGNLLLALFIAQGWRQRCALHRGLGQSILCPVHCTGLPPKNEISSWWVDAASGTTREKLPCSTRATTGQRLIR